MSKNLSLEECMEIAEKKKCINIFDSFLKTNNIINDRQYSNILCSLSGGSDSDIMLDIVYKCDKNHIVKYVWFDTGIEYQATKDHISYLENKYNISIIREKANKTIPITCKEYGQPFISKYVSEHISKLQSINFNFKDDSFENLSKLYPENISTIKWWCNKYTNDDADKYSRYDIGYNKWLKEFLIENPPDFKISSKCCTYAKKLASKHIIKKYNSDLMLTGIRKYEGGIRSMAYKNCFSYNPDGISYYRPIFWFINDDKEMYEYLYDIQHSECYTKYGMKRTGCAGCPFNTKLSEEIDVIKNHEPLLYKAINNIFKDSYDYTKKFIEFKNKQRAKLRKGGDDNGK